MFRLNSVLLCGRLTRDPELRQTTSGKHVCDFSIAVPKLIKPADGSPDADFFRVNCWDRTAQWASENLQKNSIVVVEGRLQSRKYVASDGSNREVVEVIANNVSSHPVKEGQSDA